MCSAARRENTQRPGTGQCPADIQHISAFQLNQRGSNWRSFRVRSLPGYRPHQCGPGRGRSSYHDCRLASLETARRTLGISRYGSYPVFVQSCGSAASLHRAWNPAPNIVWLVGSAGYLGLFHPGNSMFRIGGTRNVGRECDARQPTRRLRRDGPVQRG